MYQKIILSLALNHGISQKAIQTARTLLSEGGEIIAVHVYEQYQGSASAGVSEEAIAKGLQATKELLAQRVSEADDLEAVLLKGHSGLSVTEYAEKINADCIIVGSHKPGLRDYFLGSTAARIVRHAPCSVHVLR
jgi:nucleotide-binding universal stress UspA family protein